MLNNGLDAGQCGFRGRLREALRNSIANTVVSSANLLCETFERFFLRALRNSNWPVASESDRYGVHVIAREPGLTLIDDTSCCVLSE